MYFSLGPASAPSVWPTAPADALIGDSNFTPAVMLLGGAGSESYFVMMAMALFSAGATLSVSVPCNDGHMPPPTGLVPQAVVKPKRTCASTIPTTLRTASLRMLQELSLRVGQTTAVDVVDVHLKAL